jgi:multiple sugar transport system substrate-binding protein
MRQMKAFAVMALILTFVFVTACGKNNGATPADTGSASPAASPTATASAPASVTPEPAAFDFGGKDFTILTWVKEDVPSAETEEGQLRWEKQREVEKKYNVKIKWKIVPWGQPSAMLTTAGLSGDPVASVLLMDYYFAYPAITAGLVRPVDDLFDFSDPKWPKGMKDFGTIQGKTYGFKDMINLGAGIYYNKTLFKRDGLPDPHDLQAKGEWTWAKFLEIAKLATKDTNGDGQNDQFGFADEPDRAITSFMGSNGGRQMELKDGKYVFTPDAPKTMEALHFISDMYNKDKVVYPNKEGADPWTDATAQFNTGKVAMMTGELWEGKERKDMTDEQGFITLPVGPSAGTDFKNPVANFTMYYIPANVKEPQQIATIWQELVLWDRVENNKRALFEDQKLAAPEDVDSMMKATETVEPFFIPGRWAFGDAEKAIIKGEAPETAVAKVKSLVQATIDTDVNAKLKP